MIAPRRSWFARVRWRFHPVNLSAEGPGAPAYPRILKVARTSRRPFDAASWTGRWGSEARYKTVARVAGVARPRGFLANLHLSGLIRL